MDKHEIKLEVLRIATTLVNPSTDKRVDEIEKVCEKLLNRFFSDSIGPEVPDTFKAVHVNDKAKNPVLTRK